MDRSTTPPRVPSCPPVALALQGGGSHGAFTWGVLDRLLEEVGNDGLRIDAISGSSAGAINGALCTLGLADAMNPEGAARARRLLSRFWESVGERALLGGNALLGGYVPTPWKGWNIDWSPTALALEMASLVFSPYDYPFYSNPLLPLLQEVFTAEALKRLNGSAWPKLHVCAVDVATNQRRLFSQPHIGTDTLLASACVPTQFQSATIDGTTYWDGGYMGNPALQPLVTKSQDIIVVMINPLHITDVPPRTARQILDRLNEITLNTPLVLEIDAVHTVNKLLGKLPGAQAKATGYQQVRLHFICNERYMQGLGAVGKSNATPTFIHALFDAGRETAERWLRRSHAHIGRFSTCDWSEDGRVDVGAEVVDPVLRGAPRPTRSPGGSRPAGDKITIT